MQLSVIREYVTLAKLLNYHLAANELHISQPTLSNHIAALEKELSLSLIDRSHGVRLTEAGALFLEFAAGMIADFDRTLEKCKVVSKERRLSFSVQIPQVIDRATSIFVERIRQFKESHPNTNITMLPDRDGFVLDEIRDGYCDCAIFIQQVSAPEIDPKYEGLSIARLSQDEAIAWMKSDNPLASKQDLTLRDLADSVIPVHANGNAKLWEMALHNDFEAYGLTPNLGYRYAASSEEFILKQLRDTDVLMLPQGYLDSPIYGLRGDWVGVRFNPPIFVTSYLAYRNDENDSALLEFANYIDEQYQVEFGSAGSATGNAAEHAEARAGS